MIKVHVIEDDLPKLQALREHANSRHILLFDEDGYLKRFDTVTQCSRLERITHIRDKLDSKIGIAYLKKTEKGLELEFV